MHTENIIKGITLIAGADLSAKQYHFVKVSAPKTVVASGDGETSIGVLQDKPKDTEACVVGVSGVTRIVAGGAITAGADVQSDANGRAITKAAGIKRGVALETVTTAGEQLSIFIQS